MTVGLRDHVPELGRLPLLFRETFRDQATVERNGATLVGSGTTFSDGVVLNGSGNLTYTISRDLVPNSASFVLEFTLGFAANDGVAHFFFDGADTVVGTREYLYKSAADALVCSWRSATITSAYAVWSAALVAGRNTLVASFTSGGTAYAWLNGTQIATGGFTANAGSPNVLTIGSSYAAGDRFTGTIHKLEIYGSAATSVDEPHLRDGSVVEDIDLEKALVWLPGKSYYKRAADSLYVTEVRGKAGVTEALMGSDGSTTAQFPSIVQPRGFSFDGGDQINLGDNDQFSFTTGSADKPLSLAGVVTQTGAVAANLIVKATTFASVGEFELYTSMTAAGTYSIVLLLIDNSAGSYVNRYDNTFPLRKGKPYYFVVTYSGSGAASGIRVYIDGVRVDNTSGSSGVYTCMRNTTAPLLIGGAVTGLAALTGSVALPCLFDFELSPLQVKALTARLRRLARVA